MRARVDTSHDLVHQHAGLLSESLPHFLALVVVLLAAIAATAAVSPATATALGVMATAAGLAGGRRA